MRLSVLHAKQVPYWLYTFWLSIISLENREIRLERALWIGIHALHPENPGLIPGIVWSPKFIKARVTQHKILNITWMCEKDKRGRGMGEERRGEMR